MPSARATSATTTTTAAAMVTALAAATLAGAAAALAVSRHPTPRALLDEAYAQGRVDAMVEHAANGWD